MNAASAHLRTNANPAKGGVLKSRLGMLVPGMNPGCWSSRGFRIQRDDRFLRGSPRCRPDHASGWRHRQRARATLPRWGVLHSRIRATQDGLRRMVDYSETTERGRWRAIIRMSLPHRRLRRNRPTRCRSLVQLDPARFPALGGRKTFTMNCIWANRLSRNLQARRDCSGSRRSVRQGWLNGICGLNLKPGLRLGLKLLFRLGLPLGGLFLRDLSIRFAGSRLTSLDSRRGSVHFGMRHFAGSRLLCPRPP